MTDAALDEAPRRRAPRMRIEDGVPIIPDEGDVAFKPEPQPPMDAMAAAVPQASVHAAPEGWYPMEDAPSDGKPVWLMFSDHSVVEAVWRHTRVFDRHGGGKWREIAFWALRFSGGIRVNEDGQRPPIAWRPVNSNV